MKKVLIYFILLMALILAGIVAVVSVTGLMKVFAGAGTMGLIFFIAIEVAKVIGTSAIHTYKKKLHWLYRYAMMLGIGFAMAITSMGIYGFLSDSYKQATDSMALTTSKVEIVRAKKVIAEEDKTSLNLQIEQKRERIKSLTAVRKSQETRMDSLNERGQTWSAGKIQKAVDKADENIAKADTDIGLLSDKVSIVNDSLGSYQIQILELEHNSEGAAELNSLKYLSDVTGMSMDDVMKWFIFLLILIGDPMAILFVIYFNKIVNSDDDEGTSERTMEPLPKPLPEDNSPINEYYNDIQDNMRKNSGTDDLEGKDIYAGPPTPNAFIEEPVEEPVEEDNYLIDYSNPVAKETDEYRIDTSNMPELMSEDDYYSGNTLETVVVEPEDKVVDPMLRPIPVVETEITPEVEPETEITPEVEEEIESTPEEVTLSDEDVKKIREMVDGPVRVKVIEEVIEPEAQIAENIEVVKELKREPIVPRGKIIEEDLESITNRGFSVPVPDPKSGKPVLSKPIIMKRRRRDEIG